MTTISISLKDLLNVASATQISFTLVGAVFTTEGSTIKVGDKVTKTTDSDGLASVELSVGNYLVQVGAARWTIGVDGITPTANLVDLITLPPIDLPQRGLPSGGTTEQVLKKNSSTDYDVDWGEFTKSDVGLGNVDNTSDTNKPVSTATQTVLNLKEDLSNKSADTNLGSSDTAYPTQNAVKTYADNIVVGSLNYRGGYDASTNTYPTTGGTGTGGAVRKGNMWIISVAGTLGGQPIQVGDTIIANINTPGQTSSNWNTLNSNVTYVPEDQANKSTTMTGNTTSNIVYLTAKAIYDWATGLFATITGTQTLTNKTIDGGNNTLANIPLSALPAQSRFYARQASAVTAPADTNENTLYTLVIPANTIKAGAVVRFTIVVSTTNNANAKTLRVKFGVTSIFGGLSYISNVSHFGIKHLHCRTINTQMVWSGGSVSGVGASGSAVATFGIDFSVDQTMTVTAQKATAGDSFILEDFLMEILNA